MSAEESARVMQRYKESLGGYTYLLWENNPNTPLSVGTPTQQPSATPELKAANVG